MGAVFIRLWSKGFLGGFGTPAVHPELEKLLGWGREDLRAAFERFCRQPGLAVTLLGFADILRLESSSEERPAFQRLKPKKDKVDMLAVFAAMVATSNQRFISRVSFLFSIFDLDSSGTVNCAEFFIGVRSIVHGLVMFFDSAVMPSKRELEDTTAEVFDRIDRDHSGFISLGELLNYSYRTGDIKKVLEPFPANDHRLFEQLICFPRDTFNDKFTQAATEKIGKFQAKVDMHPYPSEQVARRHSEMGVHQNASNALIRRAGPPPKEFTKAHAWFIYRVFNILAGVETATTIPDENLQKLRDDNTYIYEVLNTASAAASLVTGAREKKPVGKQAGRISIVGDAKDLTKLVGHLQRYFHDRHAGEKLDAFGEGSVTLRAFFCVILHSLTEGEIETCLRWCQSFRAHDVLKEFMVTGQTHYIDCEDIRMIFETMDTDHNGKLTVEELMEGGELERDQAEILLKRLDGDMSGEISAAELEGVLRNMDTSIRASFRLAFEMDVHNPTQLACDSLPIEQWAAGVRHNSDPAALR